MKIHLKLSHLLSHSVYDYLYFGSVRTLALSSKSMKYYAISIDNDIIEISVDRL